MTMRITYLLNSGFSVELEDLLLVFDAYEDPSHTLEELLGNKHFSHVYFFASHSHYDHFNGDLLARYAGVATRYVLSHDIRHTVGARKLPEDKIVWMEDYSDWRDDAVAVQSFSSTDIGTSFRVEAKGQVIFHAGDFNFWDWLGDTHENRMLAANGFHKQLKRMEGMTADVAFFPVDGRLEAAMAKGAEEFCAVTEVGALVTMHSVGFPRWQPDKDFFRVGHELPVWSPVEAGEAKELASVDKRKEFR